MFYQSPGQDVNTPAAWDANRLGWLGLAWFDGFGTRTLHKLAARYGGNGEAAWSTSASVLLELGVTEKIASRFAEYRREKELENLAEKLDGSGIDFMLENDTAYPPLLKQISDPPFALFVRGDLQSISPAVAIVGTRNCTPYGKTVATELARDLSISGMGIVSGLALGIDAYAHQATLESGGRCLAVLGSGCDDETIYPRHNLNLAHEILDSGGAVISEFPPGAEGLKHHFPLRNRIIAGISRATIVVEAAEESGSLITAHLALEQNRDVFAVPGPITNVQSGGTNKLLKQGAIPCTGAADILEHFEMTTGSPRPGPAAPTTGEEQEVLEALDRPLHVDDIGRALGLEAASLAGLLVTLELKGWIKNEGGQMYSRTLR
ncbi:MAG: DNA-processing protein DprA [Patescibacteria group bacterium]